MPWTFPGTRSAVTTDTPVANCPHANRNSAAVGDFDAIFGIFKVIITDYTSANPPTLRASSIRASLACHKMERGNIDESNDCNTWRHWTRGPGLGESTGA